MDINWYHYVIVIVGSAVAGFINTLAGNGSTITLTILTEVLGLPANLANGTNRVGIMGQSTMSVWVFYRKGKLDVQRSRAIIFFTIIGAIVGVWVATQISNESFDKVFRWLMVLMLVVILVEPKRWLRESDLMHKVPFYLLLPASLLLGFYGGFIQMGMGIFFLAFMVLAAKYSLIEANAVKIAVVGIYTIIVIAIFEWQGLIDWKIGAIMAVGQMVGGWLAATFATNSPQANVWAHRLLIVVVILAVIKLFDLHLYL